MSALAKPSLTLSGQKCRQILGLQFFTGTAQEAVELMKDGGLLVVPAAPALKDLPHKADYREALLGADLTITDSGFMVLLWNLLERDNIPKVSGLAYLRHLLLEMTVRERGKTFWIMASAESQIRNLDWLKSQQIQVAAEDTYIAPVYGERISDEELLSILKARRPAHIVVTIGGGTQERLGLYLKHHLDYHPAIHCLGAAIGFLSGDQVKIPVWADQYFMGWLFRCLSEPRRYVGRYWGARKLLPLILKYRDRLPSVEV